MLRRVVQRRPADRTPASGSRAHPRRPSARTTAWPRERRGTAAGSNDCVSSHSTRVKPCPVLPRRSASAKCSTSAAASSPESPSARSRVVASPWSRRERTRSSYRRLTQRLRACSSLQTARWKSRAGQQTKEGAGCARHFRSLQSRGWPRSSSQAGPWPRCVGRRQHHHRDVQRRARAGRAPDRTGQRRRVRDRQGDVPRQHHVRRPERRPRRSDPDLRRECLQPHRRRGLGQRLDPHARRRPQAARPLLGHARKRRGTRRVSRRQGQPQAGTALRRPERDVRRRTRLLRRQARQRHHVAARGAGRAPVRGDEARADRGAPDRERQGRGGQLVLDHREAERCLDVANVRGQGGDLAVHLQHRGR